MYHDTLCLFGAFYSKQCELAGGMGYIEKEKGTKQKTERKGVIKECIE